jgi:alanyl-tRNA synthetase
MTHNELRRIFLEYFGSKGHKLVPSSSLVPRDDPTLLFTTAGMVQFKSLYSTTGELPYQRAMSIQKCLRAGGKDSDLENVGHSPRHLTFFEMLGHFSFGDYFKNESVAMAWEFFSEILKVDTERLWVSVFEDDDEAVEAWKAIGFPSERIVRLGAADNFWGPAGDTGACGPSSEIYWDLGPEHEGGEIGGGVGFDDRYVEVWNSVFPQYDQQKDGSRSALANRGIDMGSGFERMLMMLQGKANVFETDLFRSIMDGIKEMAGFDGPEEGEALVALRRVADHARTLTFTLSEGLVPSNVGRGYVLRRILRRAMMSLRVLGLREPMLYRVMGLVAEVMGDSYPELREKTERVAITVKAEEERFLKTLEQGVTRYRELVEDTRRAGSSELAGDQVFRLYSTYGIPWEMTLEMAEEEGLGVDEPGYRKALEADRRLSQESSRFDDADPGTGEAHYEQLAEIVGESEFVGYNDLETEVRALEYRAIDAVQMEIVLNRSPFYATSGGQIADLGTLEVAGNQLEVIDVQRRGSRHLHRVRLPEGLETGALIETLKSESILARVDSDRRAAIARAHTATHLMHAALHSVIGDGATQAGSWVGPDRLRFDFNHHQAVTVDELAKVEDRVTEWILGNLQVSHEEMAYTEALSAGAMALFGEKYGDSVRVVSVGDISTELCGGTHLDRSGSIGAIIIVAETSVASGIRRIEALTGLEAHRLNALRARTLSSLSQQFKAREEEILDKVADLAASRQKLRKDIEDLQAKQAAASSDDLLSPAGEFGGMTLFTGELNADSPKAIRAMADSLRGKLKDGPALLKAEAGGKLSFLVLVPDTLAGKIKAGELVAAGAAAIGGRGGGSPTLAQAGLPDTQSFAKVLAAVSEALGG